MMTFSLLYVSLPHNISHLKRFFSKLTLSEFNLFFM